MFLNKYKKVVFIFLILFLLYFSFNFVSDLKSPTGLSFFQDLFNDDADVEYFASYGFPMHAPNSEEDAVYLGNLGLKKNEVEKLLKCYDVKNYYYYFLDFFELGATCDDIGYYEDIGISDYYYEDIGISDYLTILELVKLDKNYQNYNKEVVKVLLDAGFDGWAVASFYENLLLYFEDYYEEDVIGLASCYDTNNEGIVTFESFLKANIDCEKIEYYNSKGIYGYYYMLLFEDLGFIDKDYISDFENFSCSYEEWEYFRRFSSVSGYSLSEIFSFNRQFSYGCENLLTFLFFGIVPEDVTYYKQKGFFDLNLFDHLKRIGVNVDGNRVGGTLRNMIAFDRILYHEIYEKENSQVSQDKKDMIEFFNLKSFSRYSPFVFQELYDNYRGDLEEKPIALVLIAEDDWNGAFYINKYERLLDYYDLIIYEISSKEELVEKIKETNERFGKIDLMFISGHGTFYSIGFTDVFNEIWLGDESYLSSKGLDNYLSHDAKIILESCSTGKGGVKGLNIANVLHRVFQREVFAPSDPAAICALYFSDELDSVAYFGADTFVFDYLAIDK